MALESPSSSAQPNGTRGENHKFKKLSENTYQKVQIEKYRLTFLLNCRKLKRPPPTLRCTGFKALEEEERIKIIA